MLGVSRKTDYAVRIMLHLACLGPDGCEGIAAIAKRRRLPVPFVRRLVAPLIKAGLLRSMRGARGGIALGRAASAITLFDMVVAMEGEIAFNHCLQAGHSCPLAEGCPVQSAWMGAGQVLTQHLSGIRLDRLAAGTPGHATIHRAKTTPR